MFIFGLIIRLSNFSYRLYIYVDALVALKSKLKYVFYVIFEKTLVTLRMNYISN